MAFDGMMTTAVVRILNKQLSHGKIEKVYQPEKDEIVMHIRANGQKLKLLLSVNSNHARAHLLEEKDLNPPNPSSFCMLLRKYTMGGRIQEIKQVNSERIIEIYIDTVNEMGYSSNKKLVIEIMGKHSNLILVDLESNRIIDSIKRISIDVSRSRQVLPGLQYETPPDQGKVSYFNLSREGFNQAIFSNSGSMDKRLVAAIQGISPAIANEICTLVPEENDAGAIYVQLASMVRELDFGRSKIFIYQDENNVPVDFHVFPRSTFPASYEEIIFEDIHEGIAYFYSHRDTSNRLKQKSVDMTKALTTHLDKLYLKKQRLLEDLLQAKKGETYRLYGEIITANIHSVEPGKDFAILVNYYIGDKIRIPLDPLLTPAQNAQKYYKRYSKAKTATVEKRIQLQEAEKEIQYLESVLIHVEYADSMESIDILRQELVENGILKKKKNLVKPPKFMAKPLEYVTSDGYKVLVGKNNKENDHLTFKIASPKDIWLHTKDIPGSHVIIVTNGRAPTEIALYEAAAVSAYHSKGRMSAQVPVDYLYAKYVKKPNGAKAGMVIFTNNKTLYVKPNLLNPWVNPQTEHMKE